MEIFLILLLTLLNSFFSISEIALISVKKNRIQKLASDGNNRAKAVLQLLDNPEEFLSSIQVGITLIGIIAGVYSGATLSDQLANRFVNIGLGSQYASAISYIVVVGAITYFTTIFGELVPKTIAINNSEKVALFSVYAVKYFTLISYPFVKILSLSTNLILKIFKVQKNTNDRLSEEDLQFMLKTAYKQGVIESDENQLHQNLFYFSDQIASSLMIHKDEVEWLNAQNSTEMLLDQIKESIHGRFLLCDGTIDEVLGIVTMKDFLNDYKNPNFNIKDIVSKPVFISPNTSVFKILNLFKNEKQHIGIVVDEFGDTKGIITVHDLMEAIVGSLPDENDEDEPNIIHRKDGSHLIDGRTQIYEINQHFKKEILEEDMTRYTTISGFLIEKFGRIPDVSEKTIHKEFEFEIVDKDSLRIDKIIMTKKLV